MKLLQLIMVCASVAIYSVQCADLIGEKEQLMMWRLVVDRQKNKKVQTLLPSKLLMDFQLDARLIENPETPTRVKSAILWVYMDFIRGDTFRFVYSVQCRNMCLSVIRSKGPAWLRYEAFVNVIAVDNHQVRFLELQDEQKFTIAPDLKALWDSEKDPEVRQWLDSFEKLLVKGDNKCFRTQELLKTLRTDLDPVTDAETKKLIDRLTPFFEDIEAKTPEVLKKPDFMNRSIWEKKMFVKCYDNDKGSAPDETVAHFSKILENAELPVDLRYYALVHLSKSQKYADIIEKAASEESSTGLRLDAWHFLYLEAERLLDGALLGRLVKYYEAERDSHAQAAMFMYLTWRSLRTNKRDHLPEWVKMANELMTKGLSSTNDRVRNYARMYAEKKFKW
jgi:hypothetical protein